MVIYLTISLVLIPKVCTWIIADVEGDIFDYLTDTYSKSMYMDNTDANKILNMVTLLSPVPIWVTTV